jgi:hypothetical protein
MGKRFLESSSPSFADSLRRSIAARTRRPHRIGASQERSAVEGSVAPRSALSSSEVRKTAVSLSIFNVAGQLFELRASGLPK